jgi:hypothetical protein
MSLPTRQVTPDIPADPKNDRRERLLQKLPGEDSPEFNAYLQELKGKSLPDLDFFLALLLSALAFYLAIVLNEPLILFVAAISAPFVRPLAGLPTATVFPSISHFFLSLLGLLATAIVYFASGWLAGLTQSKSLSHPSLPMTHLLRSTWLEWGVLILAAFVLGHFFAHLDERYRLASAAAAYLAFLPLGLVGYLFQVMSDQSWLAALVIVGARIAVTAFGILAGLWMSGCGPRKNTGFVLTGILALLLLAATSVYAGAKFTLIALDPIPEKTAAPSITPQLPAAYSTSTPAPTHTKAATATLQPTATSTPEPISAKVVSASGIIVRAKPDTSADVVTYLNDGAEVAMLGESQMVGEALWQKVLLPDGKTGWVLGRLLATPIAPKP